MSKWDQLDLEVNTNLLEPVSNLYENVVIGEHMNQRCYLQRLPGGIYKGFGNFRIEK